MINKVKLSPGIWHQWYRCPETKKPLTSRHIVEIIIDGTEYEFPEFITINPDLKFEFYFERIR